MSTCIEGYRQYATLQLAFLKNTVAQASEAVYAQPSPDHVSMAGSAFVWHRLQATAGKTGSFLFLIQGPVPF